MTAERQANKHDKDLGMGRAPCRDCVSHEGCTSAMWSGRLAGSPVSLFSTLLARALYFLMVYSLQHRDSRAMSVSGHSYTTYVRCSADLWQD